MSEKKWEQFFNLIDEIVTDLSMSWQDKAKEVVSQSKENSSEGNFEEFIGWFDGTTEGNTANDDEEEEGE